MKDLFKKFEPIDVIAVVTLLCGTILRGLKIDGVVGGMLTVVAFFYFGKREVWDKVKEKKSLEVERETVEDIIKRVAKEEGVNVTKAVRVAKCESGLDPKAVNVNKNGSKDRGVFQWNDKWHPEISDECAFDVECATRAFCKAYREGHLSWWNATKDCWS